VTITVACSPSGVEVGNAALNVSYGVLTADRRTAVCSAWLVMILAADLVQPGRRSFPRLRAKVAL
jgi:hypothetical protein